MLYWLLPWVLAFGTSRPAEACGPYFPHSMLASSSSVLLAGPYGDFNAAVVRLAGTPPKNVYGSTVLRAEADLAEARRELGPDHPALGAIQRFREDLRGRYYSQDPFPEVPEGLPPAYQLYYEGVLAKEKGDVATAEERFQQLSTDPSAGSRRLWALYSLGALNGDSAPFATVLRLVAEGEPDPLGLSGASYGWMALEQWENQHYASAISLYLGQYASGDPSALSSIRLLLGRALASADPPATLEEPDHLGADPHPHALAALAQDPTTAELVTAFLTAGQGTDAEMKAWLDLSPRAPQADLAWVAWLLRDIPRTRALLETAKDGPLRRWLQARLAILSGDTNTAVTLLQSVTWPADTRWDCSWYSRADADPIEVVVRPQGEVHSETGALLMAQEKPTEAMVEFAKGGHWFDIAHIAERVLTTSELIDFTTNTAASAMDPSLVQSFRNLVARRLAREGDWEGAIALFSPPFAALARQYVAGKTSASPDERMNAARILREHGMNLIGTELSPDFAWSDGLYGYGFQRETARDGLLAATDSEKARIASTTPTPDRWLHYRHVAAQLVWDATADLPDGDPRIPAYLCEAGLWLAARTPEDADRFYKAMVNRGRGTVLARTADDLRWFPSAAECTSLAVPLPRPEAPPSGCSVASGGRWAWLLGLVWMWRRRRPR